MRVDPPQRPPAPGRRNSPVWQQAAEGIGLVAVLAGVVALAGFVLALAISLLF